MRLIAVSKTHDAAAIERAYAEGQRDFGESYAQELARKAEQLAHLPGLRWHFIGPIQRNKAKLIAAHACMVHSIETARAAEALDKATAARGETLDVLLELNLGGEASKHGAGAEALDELLAQTRRCAALRVRGLMTVPPPDEAQSAAVFAALRALRDAREGEGLVELSMGMSSDLELAVAAGATLVRIGSAIFGERPAR